MLEIGLGPGMLTLLFFALLVVLIFSGLSLAFALGGASVVFTLLFWKTSALYMFSTNVVGLMQNIILVAVPMFIFMGAVLQRTGIGEDLYELVYRTLGRVSGGLAIGTVLICTVFAAMAGASAPATVSMGLVALPSMLTRKYHQKVAIGCIAAGGALGILIPPSVPMILYGMITGTSVGKLFIGGVLPGLLLSGMFCAYIAIRCAMDPTMGPAIPKATLKKDKLAAKGFLDFLLTLGLPIFLILSVLGSIYSGMATPTEASAVGAFGALVVAGINRRLSFPVLKDATLEALRLSSMIMWIALGGFWFSSVYQAIGASKFVSDILIGGNLGPWTVIIIMQMIFFFLGCLMDPSGIIFVTMPIFFPIIMKLGFDPVWYGVLFIVNMEMAYLTPPFGVNLFYLKAICSKDVTMEEIISACVPFIVIQAVGLILCMIFPQIIMWLPNQMIK
jgi:tripartite ATP-independent transporter DctM subunit